MAHELSAPRQTKNHYVRALARTASGRGAGRLPDARRLIANGIDPVEKTKLDKIAQSIAATNTFQAVAEEWLDKIGKKGMAAMTLKKARWLLAKTYPMLDRRPITEISAHELLLVLKNVEATKRYDTANRIRSTCSQVFRYLCLCSRTQPGCGLHQGLDGHDPAGSGRSRE